MLNHNGNYREQEVLKLKRKVKKTFRSKLVLLERITQRKVTKHLHNNHESQCTCGIKQDKGLSSDTK